MPMQCWLGNMKANNELDNRREFLRALGASRMLANALAQRTLSVPNFNLRHFQRQRFRLSVELGDSRQDVVDKEVLRAIGEAVENPDEVESRPRTPSPPRNINWHNISRDNSPVRGDRSRPRIRERDGNFQNPKDNSQAFAEPRGPVREPINRNCGPVPINRNRGFNRCNSGGVHEETRKNQNRNIADRSASRPEFKLKNTIDEFSQKPTRAPNNRNSAPTNALINRNRDVNRRNPGGDPEGLNRYTNLQEFNRNNRIDEFSRDSRHASQQDLSRNNRSASSVEFVRNNRNTNPQELNWNNRNGNVQANQQDFNHHNRNVNPREFNRYQEHANDDFYRNVRHFNDNELNQQTPQGPSIRYATQQFDGEPNFNIQDEGNQVFNRNTDIGGHLQNSRGTASNLNNSRINNNRGSGIHNFVTNQQTRFDRTSVINQRGNTEGSFQLPRERFHSPDKRSQEQQEHYIDQDIRDLDANDGGIPARQTSRIYQRIVNDNQITLCRTDWIEANARNVYKDDPPEDRGPFGPQHGHLRGPDVRKREDRGYIQNSTANQPSPREQSYGDGSFYGRSHIDQNFDGNRRHFDRGLDLRNTNDDFNQRNNSSHGVGSRGVRRFPPREDDTFQGSNNPHFQANNELQNVVRGSGSVDGYPDNPQTGGPNLNRAIGPKHSRPNVTNAYRVAPRTGNPGGPSQNQATSSLDRKTKRNTIPRGTQQQRPSPSSGINPGVPRQPRSYSSASQDRNQSRPNEARDGKPGVPDQNKKIRGPNQRKPNQPAIVARNIDAAATRPAQQQSKLKPEATRNNKANPRAGQKREAESAEFGAPHRAEKPVPKRKKVDTSRSFIIGGMRLPYINSNQKKLPQPEEESYAVTFFEQTPIYNTNMYATDDGGIKGSDEDEDLSDAESMDSNRSGLQSKIQSRNAKKKVRAQLRREWTKVYRTNNYKDWHAWWRDYKWCGSAINKKLEKFGDHSLGHRFKCPGKVITEKAINQVFKSGHMGLEKNTFSHYRNMRSIYLLMNKSFLESLSVTQIEDLQDLIRGIPNHLWLYKIRAMVYLWERYHGTLKSPAPKNVQKAKELQSIAKEWQNPVFHWLAKQAFDELKAISEIAWPDFHKIYPGLKT
ncbi:uncharacterized protein LOC108033631 isoform X2 [Drosophila biarmipes]|uniref:uncharacterized protein LOC108033631 isoform X2 n=1 Tax=Drosophila biarmipes TaxID=125945 RepID=UPI001CDAC16D|nr:uncharacterized protein LOC108033631 isoform X2 [Drosophila biarmipes]